jgi:zinc finger SWIM domain-containing protein 3
VIPRVAMEFETKDHAYKCYNRYAVLKGFIISEKVVKSPHYKL